MGAWCGVLACVAAAGWDGVAVWVGRLCSCAAVCAGPVWPLLGRWSIFWSCRERMGAGGRCAWRTVPRVCGVGTLLAAVVGGRVDTEKTHDP